MRLSQDIIFFHLQKTYSVRFLNKKDSNIRFNRAIFFEYEKTPSNHVVILNDHDLNFVLENSESFQNSLLVYPGVMQDSFENINCSVITFNEQVSVGSVFNFFHQVFELFDKWDNALKNIYHEGGSFQDLLDCCSAILFDPICIVDKQFRYIAVSKLSYDRGLNNLVDANNNVTNDIVNELMTDEKFAELYKCRTVFSYQYASFCGIAKNICFQDDFVGRAMIQPRTINELITRYYTPILEHLTFFAEKLYSKHLSFSKATSPLSNIRGLISDYLNGENIPGDQWHHALQETGWGINDQLQLIQLRPNRRYDKNLYTDYLSAEISDKWRGCVIFEHLNHLLMLANRDKFNSRKGLNFNQSLAYFLRDSLLVAGMSRPFNDIKYLRSAYEQTEIALDFGLNESPSLWYFKFDDYVLKYMIHGLSGPFEREMLCSEKLMRLKQYDAERKTEYYNTLKTYFYNRFNAVSTAKKLFIQRSTFHYRMERIQELVNINLDEKDEVLYLVLSFRLLENNEQIECPDNIPS